MRRRTRGRRSARLATAAVTLVALAVWPAKAAPAAEEASADGDVGAWSEVEEWPLLAIHVALDRDGRVVSFGTTGSGQQTGRFIFDRWTPGPSAAMGHDTLPNTTETDIFCGIQINRADADEMLVFGGDVWDEAAGTTLNDGNPDINTLDPDGNELQTLPDMQRSRWYATATMLPDGSIFIQGGDRGADHPELWTPERGAELLDLDTSELSYWYPRNFVLSDGRIFGIANDGEMYYISPDLSELTMVGRLPTHRLGLGATAVMYDEDKILHFGGGSESAVTIDASGRRPKVERTDPLSAQRRWGNSTLLPDGRVLATGGGVIEGDGTKNDIGPYEPVNTAEIWDPATEEWTIQPSGARDRLYHSTALLLLDGRVLVAGGGAPGPVNNTNAELFTPDYLVSTAGEPPVRPVIDAVSSTDLVPGQAIIIGASGTGDPAASRVTLLKAGSTTHSFNSEQRLLDLPVSVQDGALQVTLPTNQALIPPGYYLLTVLDAAGVPSESVMVRVASTNPVRLMSDTTGDYARLYQAYAREACRSCGVLGASTGGWGRRLAG